MRDAGVGGVVPLLRRVVPLIGVSVPLIGVSVPVIGIGIGVHCQQVPSIREGVALVSGAIALPGEAVTQVRVAVALVCGTVMLARLPRCFPGICLLAALGIEGVTAIRLVPSGTLKILLGAAEGSHRCRPGLVAPGTRLFEGETQGSLCAGDGCPRLITVARFDVIHA